jgi:hypothetical protein
MAGRAHPGAADLLCQVGVKFMVLCNLPSVKFDCGVNSLVSTARCHCKVMEGQAHPGAAALLSQVGVKFMVLCDLPLCYWHTSFCTPSCFPSFLCNVVARAHHVTPLLLAAAAAATVGVFLQLPAVSGVLHPAPQGAH